MRAWAGLGALGSRRLGGPGGPRWPRRTALREPAAL